MESGLSASVDEVDSAAGAGAGTSADPEASSDHKTQEPDAPSSCVADPEGVPISVCSSSDWEAVTTSERHLFGRSSGCTCSSCWSGSAWGHVLGIMIIIRAYNQSGKQGYRL